MTNSIQESAHWIDCEGAAMLGIVALPSPEAAGSGKLGVLIVVGGPQYRVGSHRQFTLLARRLAAAGYPTLRFDYRGMGDSEGGQRSFIDVAADIEAAAASLRARAHVDTIILWGLCDAASALLLGPSAAPRVAGLALVNPWVRTAGGLAAVRLKHYYTTRLVDRAFWRKVLAGQVNWSDSLRQLFGSTVAALGLKRSDSRSRGAAPFQARMAEGLRSFDGPVLLALSGNDLTAREFLTHAEHDPDWRGLLSGSPGWAGEAGENGGH